MSDGENIGFWESFLDRFTRIDETLRQLQQDLASSNATIINKLNNLITAITQQAPAEVPIVPTRHLPFYSEDTILTGASVTLLINADGVQGLGDVGRSGYIVNEGLGIIYVTIDDGKGKSKQIRIDAGETFSIERADDIWVDKLTLLASGGSASYRCAFSR
jgi:hypothetical protein